MGGEPGIVRRDVGRPRCGITSALLAGLLASCGAIGSAPVETWVERPDFERRFAEAGVEGVFLLHDAQSQRYLTNDGRRALTAFSPASTYKVFHSLVALETGVLADEEMRLSWDGRDRGWSEWNRDHGLRTAIGVSCVWFYQEVARRVGEERMQRFVTEAGYGNGDIGGPIDAFWLRGELDITAYEQIDLLRRLQRDELPFSARSQAIVRDILIVEQGAGYTLRAKTGWSDRTTPQVGWYVGYVEREAAEPAFFALNLDIHGSEDGEARVAVARRILGDLGLLPAADPG